MSFDLSYDDWAIVLELKAERSGLIGRLLSRPVVRDLDSLSMTDRALSFALADLRALGDESPGEVDIKGDTIRMSHRVAARLDSQAAGALGLPPLTDLVFRTDVEGLLGSPSFRLRHEWVKNGRKQLPKRVGAILETSEGPRRLPSWLLEAVEVAESFTPGQNEAAHWETLARFRQALDPGVQAVADSTAARVSMTDFLEGLEVRLADRFSITPIDRGDQLDFEVVPFSGRTIEGVEAGEGHVAEADAELKDAALRNFQQRLRTRGALPAYRVGDGSYIVVDRAAAPVLSVMAQMQHAAPTQRTEFVRNPRPFITAAVEDALRRAGKLQDLSPAGEEEAIEAVAGPAFVETLEYSERVTGIAVYAPPALDGSKGSGTTWLPEFFAAPVQDAIREKCAEDLERVCAEVRDAMSSGQGAVEIAGHTVPATPETLRALEMQLEVQTRKEAEERATTADTEPEPPGGRLIVDTKDNFEELSWRPMVRPRRATVAPGLPAGIRTDLKQHQVESFNWQVEAWMAGLPGVLNADEQGLGKTLQAIAFLRWLKLNAAEPAAGPGGPVLVVAPTSLLENWEAEVGRHLEEPGLGHLIRLYGAGLGGHKRAGARGVDTDTGEERLDFSLLREAIAEGRGHRFWMLTTYATMTNYQHSLAKLPFSAVVFDEIQAIKNPASLRAFAARAMQADFRIGLTGTPIENCATDLWAIMDQLCPGALGTLKEFRNRYSVPDAENMRDLHGRLFASQTGLPPLALRRLKDEVAKDLPAKTRCLHPRLMPRAQAAVYEEARVKLAEGSRGAALKMLHHIRGVSVHPALDTTSSNAEFIAASARLVAAFDVLRDIAARGERALVFIEHRKMQYRFIELVRQEFGLNHVDLINGDTPIQKRQAVVDRFQRHLTEDGGFDVLVLGPRAAGTGLTLTAATHVIHLSRWWNPAVEEQCNDRVHRLGQEKEISIHVPMAVHPGYREHSFDCLLHSLMTSKRQLASAALWPMGDTAEDAAELQRMVAAPEVEAVVDPVATAMQAMFARDQKPMPPFERDGSLKFS